MGNISANENCPKTGSTKCTFGIKVKYLQNATWQGEIHCLENDQKQNFRSVLEMIKLMDEVLSNAEEDQQTISWKSEKDLSTSPHNSVNQQEIDE